MWCEDYKRNNSLKKNNEQTFISIKMFKYCTGIFNIFVL